MMTKKECPPASSAKAEGENANNIMDLSHKNLVGVKELTDIDKAALAEERDIFKEMTDSEKKAEESHDNFTKEFNKATKDKKPKDDRQKITV